MTSEREKALEAALRKIAKDGRHIPDNNSNCGMYKWQPSEAAKIARAALSPSAQAPGGDVETIAELQKRIAELISERDEARNRNASLELEAVGYSNRMHEAIARAEIVEEALVALTYHRSHPMNEPASIAIPDNFDWPPQAILILQFGISIGKSYAQIAEALSAEFRRTITADAVSSKANRDLRRETTKCSV